MYLLSFLEDTYDRVCSSVLAEAQFPVSTRFNRVQPRKHFPSQCDNTALQPQAVTLASHLASRGIQNMLKCVGSAEDLCRMTALWCKNAPWGSCWKPQKGSLSIWFLHRAGGSTAGQTAATWLQPTLSLLL